MTSVEQLAKEMHDELNASPAVRPARAWSECTYADQVRLACALATALTWRGEPVVWAT